MALQVKLSRHVATKMPLAGEYAGELERFKRDATGGRGPDAVRVGARIARFGSCAGGVAVGVFGR